MLDDDTTTHDTEVVASIEAIFVAEYVSAVDPGEAAIHAFALRNASYHVWLFGASSSRIIANACAYPGS